MRPNSRPSAIDVVDGAPFDRHFAGLFGEEDTMEATAVIGIDLARADFDQHESRGIPKGLKV
jgi:hypothetical protein